MKVPFLDLASPHRELEEQLITVCRDAFRAGAFVGGVAVDTFEKQFADFCSAEHAVGVASGTDALRFALAASGIGQGETVVTVPNTFIATTEAISQVGAFPAFIDVDQATYNMDPAALRRFLEVDCVRDPSSRQVVSKRTGTRVSAVIPVHLYGQMAEMDSILEIAAEFNLMVIEDACQAHGAEYFSQKRKRWGKAGTFGTAAAFSFYPGKNLGACGEGGAVTTNDATIDRRCRMLREHGQSAKYHHETEGYNGRLDAIQAGLLSVKLPHLAHWNEQRRRLAAAYTRSFSETGSAVVTPHLPSWSRPVYHLYVVRVSDRPALQDALAQAGIGTGIHYPVPLHLSPAYRHLGYQKGDFPVAEQAAREVLSLPMFPGLTDSALSHVVASVMRYAPMGQGR